MAELSVVIPTYNSIDTLLTQVEALLTQGDDFDVVVADNGSTDGTREKLLAAFGERRGLLIVDASGTRGGAFAKNVGVERAQSRDVAFCDADDLVAPNWIQATRDALATADVVSIPREYLKLNPGHEGEAVSGMRTLFGAPVLSGGAFACRRSMYLAVGGFDAAFAGAVDDEFSLRLFRRFGVTPAEARTVVHVRLRAGFRERVRRKHLLARSVPAIAARNPDLAPDHGLAYGVRRWGALARSALRLPFMTRREGETLVLTAAKASGLVVGSIRSGYIYL